MKLSELLKISGIEPENPIEDGEITEIVTDSRRAGYGSMFVCLSGNSDDGHAHITEALMRGATCVVAQKGMPSDLPVRHNRINLILCDNTRSAVSKLYSAWYGEPAKKLKIIAVTGTNGKTSVAVMLKAIFEAAYYKCGVVGTVACYSGKRRIFAAPDDPLANMTTPDPHQLYRMLAFMAADKVDYVFMEASSHALKLNKLDAIEFECGIFTNLTPDHLDFHLTMEDYLASKLSLFTLCKRGLVNEDSEYFGTILSECGEYCDIRSYSQRINTADFYAEDVINDRADGIKYTLRSKNTVMKIQSPIPGSFTVDNTLCAASCALMLGVPTAAIQSGLRSLSGVEGRVEKIKTDFSIDFSVFIDYAHTPDALERLLKSFGGMRRHGERIVLLFGCGGDRDKTKRREMGRIASEYADRCIITSDNSRGESVSNIINDIMSGFDKSRPHDVIESRAAAIDSVIRTAQKGDIIILAGKGHEKYEIDKSGRHEFDERNIALQAIKKYYKK